MNFKALLISSVASAVLTAGAMAQDVPQTAPVDPAAAAPMAEAESLTLQPGAIVKSSDEIEIGKLEGARLNAEGEQELTVRGADGELRSVPLPGLVQRGADIVVGWTQAEFAASAALDASEGTAATAPASPAGEADAGVTTDPIDPPATSLTTDATAEPVEPATPKATTPTTLPTDPAAEALVPGEDEDGDETPIEPEA